MTTKQRIIDAMYRWNILSDVRRRFEADRLCYSERQNALFPAVLNELDQRPDLLDKARQIEKETGCMVAHVIVTHLADGDMVDFILFSNNEDEWPYEDDDLKNGLVMSYCVSPYCDGEIGTIAVKQKMGGLVRTR